MAAGGMAVLLTDVGTVFAQTEAGVIRHAAELREAPGETSRSLASLTPPAPVTRLGERQGSWIRVRSAAGAIGWVHLFDVGTAGTPGATAAAGDGNADSNATTSALRGLTRLFSKGNTGGTTVATTTVGIRGLGAEDIANAQPNPAAVAQMETFRLDEAQARQFASSASLVSRIVEPLPQPGPLAAAQGRVQGRVQNRIQNGEIQP